MENLVVPLATTGENRVGLFSFDLAQPGTMDLSRSSHYDHAIRWLCGKVTGHDCFRADRYPRWDLMYRVRHQKAKGIDIGGGIWFHDSDRVEAAVRSGKIMGHYIRIPGLDPLLDLDNPDPHRASRALARIINALYPEQGEPTATTIHNDSNGRRSYHGH